MAENQVAINSGIIPTQDRKVSMTDTFTFELTPLSLSFANADASLSKTVNSKLFTKLPKSVTVVNKCPENTPPIFDGIVLFQKLPPTLFMFDDTAKKCVAESRVVYFVTDYYNPTFIKSLERKRRSAIGTFRMQIKHCNQVFAASREQN